ncbi:MAG: hypothetical protein JWR33_936 [Naasia sp.]|jgi:hypothetical protein|uniref:hypothetical protein n=1 Tax=Naasia sp. TaxID=2546198 RepID=UPI00262A7F58|nr:hypothetical protein [Naasia sp.]MCU1570195.1 hypothetical protein [Naasia sp.]
MHSGTESDGGDADTPESETETELRALTEDEARDLDRRRRGEETKRILVDADRRDDEATARDSRSDERERLADRDAFMDPSTPYPGQAERRAAALDRSHSKSDRESSAEDRAHLTEDQEGGRTA